MRRARAAKKTTHTRSLALRRPPEREDSSPSGGASAVEVYSGPDPVGALAEWAETLKVPPGHPLAGEPMALPAFASEFLRAGWEAHESALSVARKNGKTAVCAVLALGFLVGPLRRDGWRGAIASVSKEKAAELRSQVAAIATANGLPVRIRKSPYPGAIEGPSGQLDTLSADRRAGHASGFDLVFCDETGLFPERARELLDGLRSSVSAKRGRIVHISVRGDSPVFAEILDNPATVSRVYSAPEGCAVGDPEAWKAANPALSSIKSLRYMEAEVRRIEGAPTDEAAFRALDLNQSLDPVREMIVSVSDLRGCYVESGELPARSGPCAVGVDLGEATSGTAAAAFWPETGRLETWLAFGDVPSLAVRGRRDNAPYEAMAGRGELRTYPGRVVPVAEFLADLRADLAGADVWKVASDGYKDAEVRDFRDRAGLSWPWEFRRVGAGKQGGADVRAFQRLTLNRELAIRENLSLVSAVRSSTIRRDANGNPALNKARSLGRIDVLAAVVLACGLGAARVGREEEELLVCVL